MRRRKKEIEEEERVFKERKERGDAHEQTWVLMRMCRASLKEHEGTWNNQDGNETI